MITADQILCHLVGDYILQSDWMACNKTRKWWIASVHAVAYSLPFLLLHPSPAALNVILWSHAFIDRFRLARYLVWLKNWIGPKGSNLSWVDCRETGYPPDRPEWLTVWLLIIADNVCHLACNGLALRYL